MQDDSKKARLLNVLAHLSATNDEVEKEILKEYVYYELHIAYGLEVLTANLDLTLNNVKITEPLPDDLLKHIIAQKYKERLNGQKL